MNQHCITNVTQKAYEYENLLIKYNKLKAENKTLRKISEKCKCHKNLQKEAL